VADLDEVLRRLPAVLEDLAIEGHRARPTPSRAVVRGLLAGLAGTGVMTAYQTAVLKARGSQPSSTPAEVACRIIEGVLQREVPPDRMGELNTAMHVLYGTSWGAPYGILAASRPRGVVGKGLLAGLAVWAASLVELPAMKLAPPPWEYPPAELALDASYHLVYGLGTAAAFRALSR
jgi:hypothetical protein